MPEPVEQWWERRQRSKGVTVPYAIGRYREEWRPYPVLVRQYHPEFNSGVTLSQVPPAAEVYLVWQCDAGHVFVATPQEQRNRPGRVRRASSWCPVCFEAATGSATVPLPASEVSTYRCGHPCDARLLWADRSSPCPLCRRLAERHRTRDELLAVVAPADRAALETEPTTVAKFRWRCARGHAAYRASVDRVLAGDACPVCRRAAGGAELVQPGTAFISRHAPPAASAAEPELRRRVFARLELADGPNAVRVATAFHGHLEVWPDLVLAELKIAVEYDTVGRHGLEHVGRKERRDRQKDRLLRAVGWEVVRVRVRPLSPLGPNDLVVGRVTDRVIDELLDVFGRLRGELLVAAYRRAA